jgi:hypothetical protein
MRRGDYAPAVCPRQSGSGRLPQLFLLHADQSLATTSGQHPLQADGVSYHPER